jgi:hypothetical protein
MSCSKCKKKEMRDLIERELVKTEKWAAIILLLFASISLYGVYYLISKLL